MHSVPDPSRVRIVGPVAPFASALIEELASLGYTTTSATAQMALAASLSRWLVAEGVGLDGLTQDAIERFLHERRRRYASRYSPRALAPIVGYLRRVGAVPAAALPPAPVGAADVLLDRFAGYLGGQRALSVPVVRADPGPFCRPSPP